ncbi:MAG: DUF4387 domain-containing protein [Alphaproteobacteria bacterium]
MNIRELAHVIRTKNAGPYIVTGDLLFDSDEVYLRVKNSGVITRAHVAELYGITVDEVLSIIHFDAARCIKINIRRPDGQTSGDVDDTDVLGMQQHAPLLRIEIPEGNIGGLQR